MGSTSSFYDCKTLESGAIDLYFTKVKDIGAGGFGAVYLAHPMELSKTDS